MNKYLDFGNGKADDLVDTPQVSALEFLLKTRDICTWISFPRNYTGVVPSLRTQSCERGRRALL